MAYQLLIPKFDSFVDHNYLYCSMFYCCYKKKTTTFWWIFSWWGYHMELNLVWRVLHWHNPAFHQKLLGKLTRCALVHYHVKSINDLWTTCLIACDAEQQKTSNILFSDSLTFRNIFMVTRSFCKGVCVCVCVCVCEQYFGESSLALVMMSFHKLARL